jgi:hypothetical protein
VVTAFAAVAERVLLRTCLEHRFSSDVGIGAAVPPSFSDDVAL